LRPPFRLKTGRKGFHPFRHLLTPTRAPSGPLPPTQLACHNAKAACQGFGPGIVIRANAAAAANATAVDLKAANGSASLVQCSKFAHGACQQVSSYVLSMGMSMY
jgi:hypothetical protein